MMRLIPPLLPSVARGEFVKPLINIHRIIRLCVKQGSSPPLKTDAQRRSRDRPLDGEWSAGHLEPSDWVMG